MEEYRFKINVYNRSTTSYPRESPPRALLVKLYPDGQEIAYKWFNTYEKQECGVI